MTSKHLAFQNAVIEWRRKGYLPPKSIAEISKFLAENHDFESAYRRIALAFNGSDLSRQAIEKHTQAGESEALSLQQSFDDWGEGDLPLRAISSGEYQTLRVILEESLGKIPYLDPEFTAYPHHIPGRTYGYEIDWVRDTLLAAKDQFALFQQERTSDTAILVGNGPSLNQTDLSLLQGQDVFISNYAVKHPLLKKFARGVAVTNHLVAEQEPYLFNMEDRMWKFFPFWLRNTITPDEKTIFLNAQGGELFFSENVLDSVAWHSTVSFFWLQVLYGAGYNKVLMIGFDNSYSQNADAVEGDVIRQEKDDPNHFDPSYFKGKSWQAADTANMERTYALSKTVYEEDGRELVNCTAGGKLEVLRRSSLEAELEGCKTTSSVLPRRALARKTPRVGVLTPFWKGDAQQAELHWRLINRLGRPRYDHVHLFKHSEEELPALTMPKMFCADIEKRYPESTKLPHPAGPNLTFIAAAKIMKDQGYTHFFWLEPDCVPTAPDWLDPFLEGLRRFPDEPIVGTGGGTVVPDKPHWKNHFAGCSLYNIEKILELDWEYFVSNQLDVSFDIWLSEQLGYISIGERDDDDVRNTIIYGKHRYKWELNRKPPSVITGMFEHWRPEKFLSKLQLWERVRAGEFKLYHAIKDHEIVRSIYENTKTAVSTIIINYNNDPYLKEAIDSALDQRGLGDCSYEVIVVDDGSTDDSSQIIGSYGDRIKPIFLTHGLLNGNFNQQRALKAALRVAQGGIVFLLDGDDVFHPDKISSALPAFNDPDVVLVQHSVLRTDESGIEIDKPAVFFENEVNIDLYKAKGKANFYQPTSGLGFNRAYLEYGLRWLCVDGHEITWLDVRLTRLAPIFGKVVGLYSNLGSWRRHSKSDSISRDNVVERVTQHHDWVNDAGAPYGLYVDFKGRAKKALPRSDHARVDETAVVAELQKERKGREHVMIDVGAHFGGSAMHFDRLGWTIHCFEPDNANRAKLIGQFGKKENVTIDVRAVSDKPLKGASFFKSDESTGISGLHAFRDTHREEGKVDLTTVAEIIEERGLSNIDFLKIDVEGFDFNVLRGVPWEQLCPDAIECEYEDSKTVKMGHTWRDIAEYLNERGYSVYISEWHPIIRYGIAHDWNRVVPYPGVDVPSESWGNMLAFREDPGYTAVLEAFRKLTKKFPDASAEGPSEKSAISPAEQSKAANGEHRSEGTAKWAKLKRDPKTFFRDSHIPPLRPLQYLFPRASRTKNDVKAKKQARRDAGSFFSFLPASRKALAAERAELRAVAGKAEARLRHELKRLLTAEKIKEARCRNSEALLQAELTKLREDAKSNEAALSAELSTTRSNFHSELNQSLTRSIDDLETRIKAVTNAANAALRADMTRALQAGDDSDLALSIDAENIQQKTETMRDELEREIAAVNERADNLEQSARADVDALRLGIDQRLHAEVTEQIKALETTLKSDLSQASEVHEAARVEIDGLEKRIEAAQAGVAASKTEIDSYATKIAHVRERIAMGERQIGSLRYPDAPATLIFFGHHKCASRFFRAEVFAMAAEATGARVRRYKIKNPPFHCSMSDDLDLSNMNFKDLGKDGRDVVLFSNATQRSLARIKRATKDWKGLRILRDPRQILVSNYFHHKGAHATELGGWVWDQLARDKPLLRELSEEDGLLHELDNISKQIIETQILAPFDDDRIMTIKLEDFAQDSQAHLQSISEFLGISDIAGIDFSRTGANPESGPWQNHFTSRLREAFKERYGQALIDLGYAEDLDW